jgi:p-aminobenzoyl-glutamate transporter AbgT
MPQLTLLILRLPPALCVLAGSYLIAASDAARGYLLIALAALVWWALDRLTPARLAAAFARARAAAHAVPSALTLAVSISFAAAGIALSLESLLAL